VAGAGVLAIIEFSTIYDLLIDEKRIVVTAIERRTSTTY